jgi:hypothetical protein
MACMVILLVVTHLVVWPSSPLIWVGEPLDILTQHLIHLPSDMLTAIDQPLDKLQDLRPDEM